MGNGPSREWLEKAGEAEEAAGGNPSVGGLAADLGFLDETAKRRAIDAMIVRAIAAAGAPGHFRDDGPLAPANDSNPVD